MSAKQSFDCRNYHTMPGHLIRRAQQISVAIFMDECARQNVTPVQFASLSEIASTPGLDATRLASLIAFDRSTLGTALERMEKKGWIARTESPTDRRTKLLSITAVGKKLLADVQPGVVRTQKRILAPLSPAERVVFMRLMDKLVEMNNQVSRAPMGERSSDSAA
ncbi:MAG: MarR family transcriptional regulator [Xanthobacteraceae bacterium]|nr:MAG: MarR family transcriptional regulator [Xanthobacteraceae bacterium]